MFKEETDYEIFCKNFKINLNKLLTVNFSTLRNGDWNDKSTIEDNLPLRNGDGNDKSTREDNSPLIKTNNEEKIGSGGKSFVQNKNLNQTGGRPFNAIQQINRFLATIQLPNFNTVVLNNIMYQSLVYNLLLKLEILESDGIILTQFGYDIINSNYDIQGAYNNALNLNQNAAHQIVRSNIARNAQQNNQNNPNKNITLMGLLNDEKNDESYKRVQPHPINATNDYHNDVGSAANPPPPPDANMFMPLNDSSLHPTLNLLSELLVDILKIYTLSSDNNVTNSGGKRISIIEHKYNTILRRNIIDTNIVNSFFVFKIPSSGIHNAYYKHSNASTTLSLTGNGTYVEMNPSYIAYNPGINVISTYATIMDAAGTDDIAFNIKVSNANKGKGWGNYQYGDIDSFVKGYSNAGNSQVDDSKFYNAKITFYNNNMNQPNNLFVFGQQQKNILLGINPNKNYIIDESICSVVPIPPPPVPPPPVPPPPVPPPPVPPPPPIVAAAPGNNLLITCFKPNVYTCPNSKPTNMSLLDWGMNNAINNNNNNPLKIFSLITNTNTVLKQLLLDNSIPLGTSLELTRRHLIFNFCKYSDGFDIPRFVNSFKTLSNFNKLAECTLNKTSGDLNQIIATLCKFGGMNRNSYIFRKGLVNFSNEGDALRELNHHDLTASNITLFMLIFGGYTWKLPPAQGGQVVNWVDNKYLNPGKNKGGYMVDYLNADYGYGNYEEIHSALINNNQINTVDSNGTNILYQNPMNGSFQNRTNINNQLKFKPIKPFNVSLNSNLPAFQVQAAAAAAGGTSTKMEKKNKPESNKRKTKKDKRIKRHTKTKKYI
jgi:hypothetical protein